MSTNIDFRPLITKKPGDCTVPGKEKISPDELVDLFSSLVDTITPGDVLEVTISGSSFRHLLAHSYMNTLSNYFNPENGVSIINKKEALEKVESKSLTQAITAFNFSMARFLDGYHRLNERDKEGHSFRSRVLDYLDNISGYEENAWLVDHIRFLTHEEYQYIMAAVEKAASLYEQGFHGQHAPDVSREINETLLNPDMTVALEEISLELRKAEVNLRQALDARYLSENNAFQAEFNRIYQSCYAFEEKLTLFISLFGVQDILKPGLLTLDKGVKQRYDQFQQLRSEGIKLRNDINRAVPDSCPEFPAENVTHLLDLNSRCRIALSGWKAVSSNLIEENLIRLNRLNARDPLLEQGAEAIYECLDRLNELGVFKNKLEFNSPNFIQLQRFAGNLVKKIGEAMVYCRSYPAMVAWKSFYTGLEPCSRDLVGRLLNYETSTWVNMVETAFLRLKIGPYIHPAIIRHSGQAEEATRFFENAMRLKGKYDLMKVLTIYEATLKSKPVSRFSNPFTQQTPAAVENLTDVSEQGEINYPNFPLQFKWKPQHENAVVLKVNTVAKEFLYEFSLDQDIDWIQLDDIDRGIDAYPVTERFKVAEVVSKAFASYAPEVSIFQFKTANVIGVMPETLSKLLADTWKEYGVKQFSVQNRVCDAIIESIIETGRKQVMLVFNGLLDDQRPEQLLHQHRILKAFTRLGFEIVPVWSVTLMEDCGNELDRLASILGLIEKV